MKVRNNTLGQFIHKTLNARLKLNLKLNNLDPVVVKFTRTELREITGAVRIEHNTMERILEELREYGYEVAGERTSEHFEVTLNAKQWMNDFSTLGRLVQTTQWLEELFDKTEVEA